MEIIGALNFH